MQSLVSGSGLLEWMIPHRRQTVASAPLFPENAEDFDILGVPTPTMGIRLDVASGNLTCFISGKTFTVNNSPVYGVDSSDFQGQESIATGYATGRAFTCADAAFLDVDNATDVTWLWLGRVGNEGAGTNTTNMRTLLGKGNAGDIGHRLTIRHSDGHVMMSVQDSGGGTSANVAANHDDSLLLLVGGVDRTAGTISVASQLGEASGTLTRTGTYVTITPVRWSSTSAARCPEITQGLYGLCWIGAPTITIAAMRDIWQTHFESYGAWS